jgi:hypothetical protein
MAAVWRKAGAQVAGSTDQLNCNAHLTQPEPMIASVEGWILGAG